MLFASDNCAGVAPEISEALLRHATGMADAYGTNELDKAVEKRFAELFETKLSVFFVGTGTAANSLAIAATMRPGGVVYCHDEAHVRVSEAGAPEFLSGGGRLVPISGANGKIDPANLHVSAQAHPPAFNHLGRGTMVTCTQATEAGTIYTLDEIAALGKVAAEHGLAFHMDGARFANALVKLNCSPAEMTWKQGVNMVSFGATKNGCWCAEALVAFDPNLAAEIEFLRKRSGHLFSKTRFISAQFEAYLENDLWLKLARHSNAIGEELERVVRESNRVRLAWPSDSNQVFFVAGKEHAARMRNAGAKFHAFPAPSDLTIQENEELYRLVGAFSSTEEDVESFRQLLSK